MPKKITDNTQSKKGMQLTKETINKKGKILTTEKSRPFIVCFEYILAKNYNFTTLSKSHLKELQSFLDRVSELKFEQVDKLYLRSPDKQDMFKGMQVKHYGFGDCFRIHGVIKEGKFFVIRLDPNHSWHG